MSEATIKVQGKGAIHVVPDVTRVEITIQQWFENHSKAYAQAKENSAWMVKILEYNNKPGKLAKTVRFDIEDYSENEYDDDGHYISLDITPDDLVISDTAEVTFELINK